MQIEGFVINEVTGDPVPAATVEAWSDNLRLSAIAANDNGFFVLDIPGTPSELRFSSASFFPAAYKYPDAAGINEFELSPRVVEGEPVVVTATKKKNKNGLLLLALVGLAVWAAKK